MEGSDVGVLRGRVDRGRFILTRMLAVSLLVAGIPSLPPPLGGLLTLPQAPPQWSTSRYMETTDTDRTYDMGCAMGSLVDEGRQPGDGVVVLDFGMPVVFGGGAHGASLFSGRDQRTKAIRRAGQAFAHGFWACTLLPTATLTLALGTSNYGPDVTYAHGKAWAGMVNKANEVLMTNGWGLQVVIVGAIDLEPSWSSPGVADRWLDGFDAVSDYRVLNFGDAAGCPPASPSCGTSSHPEWTQHDMWWVSWGHVGVWPLPEIYRNDGIMAEQWHQIAHHGLGKHHSIPQFAGAMTQWNACREVGCDPTTDNTAEQGWSQLWDAVNDGDGTDQTPAWSTDISWKN